MSLQYGVPLEDYVNKFSHTRFEPQGYTKNPDIRIAKSLVDYIFRWLGITFLPGFKEASLGITPGKDDDANTPSAPGSCRGFCRQTEVAAMQAATTRGGKFDRPQNASPAIEKSEQAKPPRSQLANHERPHERP